MQNHAKFFIGKLKPLIQTKFNSYYIVPTEDDSISNFVDKNSNSDRKSQIMSNIEGITNKVFYENNLGESKCDSERKSQIISNIETMTKEILNGKNARENKSVFHNLIIDRSSNHSMNMSQDLFFSPRVQDRPNDPTL